MIFAYKCLSRNLYDFQPLSVFTTSSASEGYMAARKSQISFTVNVELKVVVSPGVKTKNQRD